MAGGLIQLVARSVQDLYLTGDPQITFFKTVYRRHTNFAIESIQQSFSTDPKFGEKASCTLSYVGDLVNKTYIYVELSPVSGLEKGQKFAWVKNLGHAIINDVTIEIGEKIIDRQYGEWLHIWSEVSNKQDSTLNKMIGNVDEMTSFTTTKPSYKLYIPLHFWFCKEYGLSLPVNSLTKNLVKINVSFRPVEECYCIGPTHSIRVMEDIVPFQLGDYIEQTVNKETIYGYVIDYDFLQKKLSYIKINSPTSIKKTFESYQQLYDTTDITSIPTSSVLFQQFRPGDFLNKKLFDQLVQSVQSTQSIQSIGNNQQLDLNESTEKFVSTPFFYQDLSDIYIPYRIYNSIDRSYCTPTPHTLEYVESTRMVIKPKIIHACLYVDYIFLDQEERQRFATSTLEYLIDQVQYNQEINIQSPNVKQNLSLNNSCKSHYWVAQLDSLVGAGTVNDLFNYTSSHINSPTNNKFTGTYGKNIIQKSSLSLNGKNRYGTRNSTYTNMLQAYQHHHRGPTTGINVYSPSIYPENYQPSSTINMSKIDHVCMSMTLDKSISPLNTVKIRSYTINYNIMRIAYGMCGLVF